MKPFLAFACKLPTKLQEHCHGCFPGTLVKLLRTVTSEIKTSWLLLLLL